LSEFTIEIPLTLDADGVVRIGGTLITLDSVVYSFQEGSTADQIVDQYPVLEAADVYAVIGYYLNHREDIDPYLSEQRRQPMEVHSEDKAKNDRAGIRERLLARCK
jgi:uncharacterized protein (DUF433 family)